MKKFVLTTFLLLWMLKWFPTETALLTFMNDPTLIRSSLTVLLRCTPGPVQHCEYGLVWWE